MLVQQRKSSCRPSCKTTWWVLQSCNESILDTFRTIFGLSRLWSVPAETMFNVVILSHKVVVRIWRELISNGWPPTHMRCTVIHISIMKTVELSAYHWLCCQMNFVNSKLNSCMEMVLRLIFTWESYECKLMMTSVLPRGNNRTTLQSVSDIFKWRHITLEYVLPWCFLTRCFPLSAVINRAASTFLIFRSPALVPWADSRASDINLSKSNRLKSRKWPHEFGLVFTCLWILSDGIIAIRTDQTRYCQFTSTLGAITSWCIFSSR